MNNLLNNVYMSLVGNRTVIGDFFHKTCAPLASISCYLISVKYICMLNI